MQFPLSPRVALGRVLPPHQAPAELQVALRVTESLEALPEQVDVLLAMSAMMAQDGQHGKARALNEQALELLPSWHEKAREIRRALSAPAVVERYRQLDTVPDGGGPEAFLQLVRRETPRWAEVVSRSGAKVD